MIITDNYNFFDSLFWDCAIIGNTSNAIKRSCNDFIGLVLIE